MPKKAAGAPKKKRAPTARTVMVKKLRERKKAIKTELSGIERDLRALGATKKKASSASGTRKGASSITRTVPSKLRKPQMGLPSSAPTSAASIENSSKRAREDDFVYSGIHKRKKEKHEDLADFFMSFS